MTDELRLEVRRDDVATARVRSQPLRELADGEALFEVERFGMSANNITYGALVGDQLGYWTLFPAPDGWGQIPVWAYLRVLTSRSPAVHAGALAYGFAPPASHVILSPQRVSEQGFIDAALHRSGVDLVYNSYSWLAADPAYDPNLSDELLILRPLFWLSFLLDDLLAEDDLAGGRAALITSASSKAAIGTAHLLAKRGVSTVGLTSAANMDFVKGLELYDDVHPYDELTAISRSPAVLLDIAGSRAVRQSLQSHFGTSLRATVIAGGTHQDRDGADTSSQDGRESFFFGPTRMRRRAKELGWLELGQRYCGELHDFASHAASWLEVTRSAGAEDVMEAYRSILENAVPPNRAQMLSLAADRLEPTPPQGATAAAGG